MTTLRGPFDEPSIPLGLRVVAPLSVMAGSLVTIWPYIASFPLLPPFGLLALLAWRLRRAEALPIWAPLALGLFDDLFSGQPIGSAIVLWTGCFFALDLIEQRLMSRDFWHDWVIASGCIATCLVLGRLIAAPFAAQVDTPMLVQATVAILCYPLVATAVGWLDDRRSVS